MSENKLLKIGALDIEIAQLENSKLEYPKKLSELKATIREKEMTLLVSQNNLAGIEKGLSSENIELEANKKALDDGYERLNEVKTNKEYDAVQKEIKKRKSFVDENNHNIAKLKEKLSIAEENLKLAEEDFDKVKNENSAEIEDLTNKIAAIDNDISTKIAEKEKIVPEIPQNLMNLYNSILVGRKKSGKVISLISSDSKVCSYCKQKLSPNILKKIVTSTSPVVCENCGSLFVFEENSDETLTA